MATFGGYGSEPGSAEKGRRGGLVTFCEGEAAPLYGQGAVGTAPSILRERSGSPEPYYLSDDLGPGGRDGYLSTPRVS